MPLTPFGFSTILGLARLLLEVPGETVAVGAAALASSVIGGLWYSLATFGRIETDAREKSETGVKAMRSQQLRGFLAAFIRNFFIVLFPSIVAAFVIMILVGVMRVAELDRATNLVFPSGAVGGLSMGFLFWLVSLPTTFGSSILHRRLEVSVPVNLGYSLVSYLVIGFTVGAALL